MRIMLVHAEILRRSSRRCWCCISELKFSQPPAAVIERCYPVTAAEILSCLGFFFARISISAPSCSRCAG